MKYMQSGGFQSHPLMRLTLGWTLVFMTGLWVTNAALQASRIGLTPGAVAEHYRGSEEDFRPARTPGSMLEVSHAHLGMLGLVVLLLTHLAIFAPLPERTKGALIHAAFASAFVNEGSGWLVRLLHPGFAWLKLAAFLAFQASLGALMLLLASFLASEISLREISRSPRDGGHARAKMHGPTKGPLRD